MAGSVYAYDPCRDPATGRRYKPGDCPKWSTSHRRWGFIVDLGLKWDEEKGRRVRQQLRREGFTRRIDAENALDEEKPGIRRGDAPSLADRRLTVADWADRWLAIKAGVIRPATLKSYRQTVEAYVKPSLGSVLLPELRADDLDGMLAGMRSGKLADSSIRQHFTVVSVMLGAAVKRRLIPYSPTAGVELGKAERRPGKIVWSPVEADTFIGLAGQHQPRLAIAFRAALAYGLRRGELAGLRWSDIDTVGGWLTVEQNLGETLVSGPPKTDAGYRSVPLSIDPGFAAALREHRKRQLADRLAAGAAWTDTGLVLAAENGGLVKPWRLSDRFTALRKEAGLPKITLHGCRGTANSIWAAAGVDKSVRDAWAGWSNDSMADGTYLAIRPETHQAAAKQVAAYRAANGLHEQAL